jgi:hypothetical protein
MLRGAVTGKATARGRYAGLQPVRAAAFVSADAYEDAGLYLADTLDLVNQQWDSDGALDDDDYNTQQYHSFPQP